METLVISIKNKKDSKLIKDLLSRLDVEVRQSANDLRKALPKSKFKNVDDFLSYAGSLKGQFGSKSKVRSLAWKKRNW